MQPISIDTGAVSCLIGIERPDGQILAIQCFHNGGPEGVGAVLQEHYRDDAKVVALMGLGDLYSLGPELGERHDPQRDPHPTWCVAMVRDLHGQRARAGGFQAASLFSYARYAAAGFGVPVQGHLYLRSHGVWSMVTLEPVLRPIPPVR